LSRDDGLTLRRAQGEEFLLIPSLSRDPSLATGAAATYSRCTRSLSKQMRHREEDADAPKNRRTHMKTIHRHRAAFFAIAGFAMTCALLSTLAATAQTTSSSTPGSKVSAPAAGRTPSQTAAPVRTTTTAVPMTGATATTPPNAPPAIPANTTQSATPAPIGTANCAPSTTSAGGCAPGTTPRPNSMSTPPETAYPLSPPAPQ
jgi:hypothetical protein